MSALADRHHIYYWKCDHASAFSHDNAGSFDPLEVEEQFLLQLGKRFPDTAISIEPGNGQGNHLTFRLRLNFQEAFARIKTGPERDCYFDVEYLILTALEHCGVPVPAVLAHDCSRKDVPFAWQVLEYISFPDLNQGVKDGFLSPEGVAFSIGAAVARWQTLAPPGFGPFSTTEAHHDGILCGLHKTYADYYRLNLKSHLDFLVERNILEPEQSAEISELIDEHQNLLNISRGCLVHKDLALWNILGSEKGIAAFIDWDDAICGDPMDDLSLLGCFYDGEVLSEALKGYTSVRALPSEYRRRFWMHLLRNMIVKAVIRTGGGYFDLDDGFFLIGAGASGSDLKAFTLKRLNDAVQGLRNNAEIESL